jgi:hypothetical protein
MAKKGIKRTAETQQRTEPLTPPSHSDAPEPIIVPLPEKARATPAVAAEHNLLYYGDNLDILRRYVDDESVDLVYLDPPFNSNADYNVLFAERSGEKAHAQIKAFEDTWEWGLEAAQEGRIKRDAIDYLLLGVFRRRRS